MTLDKIISAKRQIMHKQWVGFRVLCFVISSSFVAFSQPTATPPTIVPPTPNALKMTEYYAQRPRMYTGTASVNIPLYNIDFDGWSLPLSLTYNATGIRTNEEASEVGLGWSLSATGVISRTIKGGDDLFDGGITGKKGFIYSERDVSFHEGLGYDWQSEVEPSDTSYYYKLVHNQPDTQPDIFNYNFFGYSGSFVLSRIVDDPEGDYVNVIKITQDACRINFDLDAKTFEVITPEGFKGEFTIEEKSTSFSSSAGATSDRMLCCGANYIDISYYQNYSGMFRTTTSWYLSKITSPNGYRAIFSYDLDGNGESLYLSNSQAFAELDGITSNQVCLQTVQEHVYQQGITIQNETQTGLLQIDFLMNVRHDLQKNTLFAGAGQPFKISQPLKKYTGINITGLDPESTLNKTIGIYQSYFNPQYYNANNFGEDEYRWMRGRLDRVAIDDQEYQFYYENGQGGVPNKLTTGIDHFGFYNGIAQTNLRVLPPEPAAAAFIGNGTLYQADNLVEDYKQKWDRRVDFNYGKAGLLKKVKYPTRGYSVFEYEPHVYIPSTGGLFNEVLSTTTIGGNSAGGARVKSIREYDYNDALLLEKSYVYLNDHNTPASPSTGKLMTPLYNRYAQKWQNGASSGANFHWTTYSTIPGNSSAEGKIIGYSKVHEIVTGGSENYRNAYYFENRINKVLAFNAQAVGYQNLNGQSIEVRNFDNAGKIVQLSQNSDYFHPIDSVKAIAYQVQPGNTFLHFFVPYTIRQSFNTPYTVVSTIAKSPSEITEDVNGNVVYSGSYLQTQKDYTFNSNYLLKTEQTINSTGDLLKTEIKRPADYPMAGIVGSMVDKNIVSPVIEEISYKNGSVVSAMGNRYESVGSLIKLRSTYHFNTSLGSFTGSTNGNSFQSPYEERITYTAYNTQNGKLLEYKGLDGLINSFIWGYNGTLPIVHGVGVSNSLLQQAHTNALPGNPGYEMTLRNDMTVAAAIITTYSHNPRVGIKKVTDSGGLSKTFQYDQYARLEKVLDNDDNILKQYQYHFIKRTPTRIMVLSGMLDFGAFYDCQIVNPKVITISNDGEDELYVSGISVPSGFGINWFQGAIPAGASVDVTVTFTGSGSGTYSGNLTINSDKTSGSNIIPVTATEIISGSQRVMQLSPSLLIASQYQYTLQYVQVSNTGNDCMTITGISHPNTPDWYISMSTPITLAPGTSTNLQVMRLSPGLPESIDVIIQSNKTGGGNIVQLRAP